MMLPENDRNNPKEVNTEASMSPRGLTMKPAIVNKTPIMNEKMHNTYESLSLKLNSFQHINLFIVKIIYFYIRFASRKVIAFTYRHLYSTTNIRASAYIIEPFIEVIYFIIRNNVFII